MNQEHPFAQYVRILGKGKNGSRALTQEEAEQALSLILNNQVIAEQLGAFLMLMRVKEETAEEIAGFVRASRNTIEIPQDMPTVTLDWSSYAGKKRQLPWFLLSALLLAENGETIFMHGASGHTAGRVYTKDILSELGLSPCQTMEDVRKNLSQWNFAYMDLEFLCPKLFEIIQLRPYLGLRSPVHTLARMLNPFHSDYVMQGIFHPGYQPVHQQSAILLDVPHLAVVKGDGGEIERNPDMKCLVQSVHNGQMIDEEWPAMFARRHLRDDEMDVSRLLKVWSGDDQDEYGIAAITGTTAIVLKMLGRAADQSSAEAMAKAMWEARVRGKYGAAA